MVLQKWIQGFLAVVTNFSAIRKCKYHVDDLRNNNILLLLPVKGLFLFVLNRLVGCFFLPVFLWEEGTALSDLSEVWKLQSCFCWWPAVATGWAVSWNEFGGAAVQGGVLSLAVLFILWTLPKAWLFLPFGGEDLEIGHGREKRVSFKKANLSPISANQLKIHSHQR